jgi:hypothetical protein
MFEDLGLEPFSVDELTDRIFEKYGPHLEYVNRVGPRFKKMRHEDEHYADVDLSLHDKRNMLIPLSLTLNRSIDPLRCDMIGGDDRPVNIMKSAIMNAMEYAELKPVAEDIVRYLNTPRGVWMDAITRVDEKYEIETTNEIMGYAVTRYPYDATMLTTGRKDSKTRFLNSMRTEWENGVKSKETMLIESVKRLGRLPRALSELEELEYRKFMEDGMRKAINKGRLEGPLPIYTSQALTMMTNKGWGFRFKGFGNAKPFLESLGKKALTAGMKVQKVDEGLRPGIEDYRTYSAIELADEYSI